MRSPRLGVWLAVAALAAGGLAQPAHAQRARGRAHERRAERLLEHDHVPGEVLIRFRDDATEAERAALRALAGARGRREHRVGHGRIEHLTIDRADVKGALEALLASDKVVYAEPNYRRYKTVTPNDPSFSQLFGLHNTGQTGGTADKDIDAPEAWGLTTGSPGVILAVIDEGMAYTHPDLAANMWRNPGESGGGKETNGIDDDGNGIVDDVHGIDVVTREADGSPSGNPINDSSNEDHATHVAGTIGAVGNNAVGVVGVNWTCELMAIRFLGTNGGTTSQVVEAMAYAVANGATAINMSYGGGGSSEAERDAFLAARAAGVICCAAAGNETTDNDGGTPNFPSDYDVDNIIAVASSDHNDAISWFSNWGTTSIDLAAPGENIFSCQPGGTYQLMSGTSMATPHVTGTVGLIRALYPDSTIEQVRARLLFNVDPAPAFVGRTVTEGRLNAFRALEPDAIAPSAPAGLTAQPGNPPFSTIALSFDRSFDDGATQAGTASAYEVRYSTSPIVTAADFDAATRAEGSPFRSSGAATEALAIDGLAHSTTYHLAVAAIDNVGNASALATTTATTGALTAVFSSDFAAGLAGWTVQAPWGTASDANGAFASESPTGNYTNGLNAALTSPTVDLTGFGVVNLELTMLYSLESGFDRLHVEVSTNGGSTWSEVQGFDGANGPAPEAVNLDLSPFAGAASFRFRLRVTTDGSVVFDGVRLYAAELAAGASAAPVVVAAHDFEGGLAGGTGWAQASWTAAGSTVGVLATGGVVGPSNVRIQRGYAYIERRVNLAGLDSATLEVHLRTSGLSGSDTAYVYASPDAGASWTILRQLSSTHNDTVFHFHRIPLPAGILTANAMISFDLAGNGTGDLYFIDGVRIVTAPAGPPNTDPVVTITAPASGTEVDEGTAITLTATATDAEDGDISAAVTWTSSAQGALGSGASIQANLGFGAHVITATVTDSASAAGSATVTVVVLDVTPPAIAAPTDLVFELTSPAGAVASFATPVVTDAHDPSPAVVCVPASGSVFAPGAHTVTCTATDASGNSSIATFTVTVSDTTPPSLTVPGDITVVDASGDGAEAVSFEIVASDAAGAPSVTSDHTSGERFDVGETSVSVTATDSSGNVTHGSFTVTVLAADTTPPVLTLPADLTVEAAGPLTFVGAVAEATALDDVDGDVPVTSDAPPGLEFEVQATSVTFTASDTAGNTASGTITVTVVDTTLPTITTPSNITVADADGDGQEVVAFTVTATDAVGVTNFTVAPPSGSTFPVGTTTVTCTATDAAGNTANATFTVTVNPAPTARFYFSFAGNTVVPGVGTVADEDVVTLDPATGTWALHFDGSDVGLSSFDVAGLDVLADGSLLLSFENGGTVGGLSVDDSDIVRFVPTSTGAVTAGTFSMYFDGSDVGLTTNDEQIDAIQVLPSGEILLSTVGAFSVPGASGNDEDVFRFAPTSLGAATSGTYGLHFDGSDVGLNNASSEDVSTLAADGGAILFSTLGSYAVSGLSGPATDVVRFQGTFGGTTSGTFSRTASLTGFGLASGTVPDGMAFR